MICAELEQAAKQWETWYFGKALDVWSIGAIQQFVQKETQNGNAGDINWYRHCCDKVLLVMKSNETKGEA
jgi:hypothetical protein|tara:strand:- start:765 stop:974 length:210 start_codon:yes stop_codon:yes gene_type:complete